MLPQQTFDLIIKYYDYETQGLIPNSKTTTQPVVAGAVVASEQYTKDIPSDYEYVYHEGLAEGDKMPAARTDLMVYCKKKASAAQTFQLIIKYYNYDTGALIPDSKSTEQSVVAGEVVAPEQYTKDIPADYTYVCHKGLAEGDKMPAATTTLMVYCKQNAEVPPTPDKNTYTLTIKYHYVDCKKEGQEVAEDYIAQLPAFAEYAVISPTAPLGYALEPGKDTVVGTMGAGNTLETVKYSPIHYTWTISYVDEEGNPLQTAKVINYTVEDVEGLQIPTNPEVAGYKVKEEQNLTLPDPATLGNVQSTVVYEPEESPVEYMEFPVILRLNYIGLESESEVPLGSQTLNYRFSNPKVPDFEVKGTLYGANAVLTTPNESIRYKWELGRIRMPKEGTIMTITTNGGAVAGYSYAFGSDNGAAIENSRKNLGEGTCTEHIRTVHNVDQEYFRDVFYAYCLPYEVYHFYYDRLEGGQLTDYLGIVYAKGSNEDPQRCLPVTSGDEVSTIAKNTRWTQIQAGNFIVVSEPTNWIVRKGSQRFDVCYARAVTATWLDADGKQIKQETIAKGQDYSNLYPADEDETGKWGEPVVDSEGNITIQWQLKTVTVTWVDEDGTLLHQLENVKLEEIPAGDQYAALFGGQNPTKAEGADYTYAFSGWNREVDTEGNVTYTAQYTPTRKPVSPPISIIIPPTQPTNPDEDIDDPEVPLGTPRPEEPTPTPDPGEDIGDPDVPQGTPRPEEPTPTPDPGEDIGDPDVPLGTPDPGDEPIEDPDVPLGTPKPEQTPAPKPGADEEDIPDGNVPLANTPKTGDDASVWLLLTAISAAGLVFLGTSEWKKRKKI